MLSSLPNGSFTLNVRLIQLGKQTCIIKYKHFCCTPRWAEPNQTWPDVLTGGYLCLLTSLWLILLHSILCCHMLEVFLWYRALGCEILINGVHLRRAVWEQGDENCKNVELTVKLWEEVPYTLNCPLIEIWLILSCVNRIM